MKNAVWARLDDDGEIVQTCVGDPPAFTGTWVPLVWREDAEADIAAVQEKLDAFADVVLMFDEMIESVKKTGHGRWHISGVRREHKLIAKAIRKLEKL